MPLAEARVWRSGAAGASRVQELSVLEFELAFLGDALESLAGIL